MSSGVDVQDLAELLGSRWNSKPGRIVPIEAGRVNQHWRIQASNGAFVLRRYSALRSNEAIDAEHAVLMTAFGRGWPVAVPIPDAAGATLAELDGGRYSLFPYLAGEPAPQESQAHRRIKGRMLARLHADLAGALDHQRQGFGRAWELDATLQSAGAESFNSALSVFGREHPDLAAAIRRQRYRNLRELARLGYGDLPSTVIHADFHHHNLLFTGAELTALLDFDSVRLDAPACDIACSLVNDCTAPPDYNAIDVDRAAAFVEGYARMRPLSVDEIEMLPALVRAAILGLVAFRLAEWTAGLSDRAKASIERTVRSRFPALDSGESRLRSALAGAVRTG